MVTTTVFNVSVYANLYLDSAKTRLTKLVELASIPSNNATPDSVALAADALTKATEADAALRAFAVANGYDLG